MLDGASVVSVRHTWACSPRQRQNSTEEDVVEERVVVRCRHEGESLQLRQDVKIALKFDL